MDAAARPLAVSQMLDINAMVLVRHPPDVRQIAAHLHRRFRHLGQLAGAIAVIP